MCGNCGIDSSRQTGDVGQEMTRDAAVAQAPRARFDRLCPVRQAPRQELVIRLKVAEQDEMAKGFAIHAQ